MAYSALQRGLIVVVFACLALPAQADEMQYLPDRTIAVMSLNFQTFLKSKAYAELKKQLPKIGAELELNLSQEIGIAATNMARISMAIPNDQDGQSEVGMIATVKPITAKGIIADKKAPDYKKNVTFKEIKIGKHVVHQENFQIQFDKEKPGKVQEGDVFCVVEEKLVIFGRMEGVRAVLERKEKPALSAGLQAGLKLASFKDDAMIVVDIAGMPAREKENLFRGLNMPGLQEQADKLRILAVKANDSGDRLKANASLVCADAETAATAKKAVDAGLASLRKKLDSNEKVPPELKDVVKRVDKLLGSIKVSSTGMQVNADVEADASAVASFVRALFEVVEGKSSDEKKAPEPEKK